MGMGQRRHTGLEGERGLFHVVMNSPGNVAAIALRVLFRCTESSVVQPSSC